MKRWLTEGTGCLTLSHMKTATLSIRLDEDLDRLLGKASRQVGRSRSEVARDALRRQLRLTQFEAVRRRIMPFAEARGFLTDEGKGTAHNRVKEEPTQWLDDKQGNAMQATIPLDTMTFPEKLRALEDIWDDLCQTEDGIPSPEWHKDVLEAREQRIQAGEAKFIELAEAKRRVLDQIK